MTWLSLGASALLCATFSWQLPQGPTRPPFPQGRPRPQRAYLLCYFVDNGEDGVFLASSDDGFKFKPLLEPNVAILKSSLGPDSLTRDPCIMHGPDGLWHMVWTSGWWKRTIGMAHSRDLVHWTQQFVPAMVDISNAMNAWAPEMVYDQKTQKYVIFWSSTVRGRFAPTAREDGDLGPENEPLNHRFYFTTTSDFKQFSPSRLLWDPGFICIDATMHRTRDGWLLFGKNETRAPVPAKCLFVASAPSPYGPFHMECPRMTGDYWAEGPTAVRANRKIRVYFDRYTEGRWGAVESTDMKTWTDVSERLSMVPGARHGTIVAVPKDFVDRVRETLKRSSMTVKN
ncbi:MAG: glycoside hydrolase family 43 protein [Fimbriimonas sp.]|nr:glycoside hydrolase family 43 protein [Fimbriimonas sp.]